MNINSTPRTAAPQWRDGPQGTPLAHAHGLWVGLVPDLTGLDKAVKDLSGELAHSPKSDGILLVPMDPEQPLGRSYSASKLAPLRIAVKRVHLEGNYTSQEKKIRALRECGGKLLGEFGDKLARATDDLKVFAQKMQDEQLEATEQEQRAAEGVRPRRTLVGTAH